MMSNSLIPFNGGLVPARRALPLYDECEGLRILPEIFPTPESPETAIARTDPFEASRLLRQYSRDRLTGQALSAASTVARDYLSNVSKERLDRSNGVRVSFERKRRFFSGGEYGFTIDLDLK